MIFYFMDDGITLVMDLKNLPQQLELSFTSIPFSKTFFRLGTPFSTVEFSSVIVLISEANTKRYATKIAEIAKL